jgi:hypothetical protein
VVAFGRQLPHVDAKIVAVELATRTDASGFMMAARVLLSRHDGLRRALSPRLAKSGRASTQTDLAGADFEIHIPNRTGEPPFGELMELDFRPRGLKKLFCAQSEARSVVPTVGHRSRRNQLLACAANI